MKANIQRYKNVLYPIIIIIAAYILGMIIKNAGPEIETIKPERPILGIRTVAVKPVTVELTVESQGEVSAEYMVDVSPEVTGRIMHLSPAFVTGGYFQKGDVLLEIDDKDFKLAHIRAESKLVEAIEDHEQELAEALLAKEGLLSMREARVNSSGARVESAKAELAQAEADLNRTKLRAPFDGRVLFTTAGIGQYVKQGEALGKIFPTELAEIRLPLSDRQLSYLDFPFGLKNNQPLPPIDVDLKANIAGQTVSYKAYLHRMDGVIDPDNRVWYAVARIQDPYGLRSADAKFPLAMGIYVDAVIKGKKIEGVYKLPRSALRKQGEILIVDKENRLRQRVVEVLKTDFDFVYITDGLNDGEIVCISSVETFVEGMPVEIKQMPSQLAGNR